MLVKTNTLTGTALNRAVSHCKEWSKPFPIMPLHVLPYSTDWSQGGPIIEREGIQLHVNEAKTEWLGSCWGYPAQQYGPTALIAAMRCYVASKLGDEVEIPDDLL